METLTSPHLARPATQEPRALVIHAHGDWLKSVQDGKFDFFKKLVRTATARGTTSRIVAADGAASRLLLGQDHMHILVGCPPSYGRGQLHALPGHVWGFWYLDELGQLARLGVGVMCRQQITSEGYGLCDKSLRPHPDFFTAILHKRLV